MSRDTPELIDRFLEGDTPAYETLFKRYRSRLEQFVLGNMDGWLLRQVPAEDVLQETHLAALERLDSFVYRRELAFFFWLCGIARNIIRMHARRLKRRPQRFSLHAPPPGVASSSAHLLSRLEASGDDPDRLLSLKEDLALMASALNDLSPRRRQAVILRYVEGLDNQEAAALMRISPGAFRVLLSRALGDLREGLDRILSESAP